MFAMFEGAVCKYVGSHDVPGRNGPPQLVAWPDRAWRAFRRVQNSLELAVSHQLNSRDTVDVFLSILHTAGP